MTRRSIKVNRSPNDEPRKARLVIDGVDRISHMSVDPPVATIASVPDLDVSKEAPDVTAQFDEACTAVSRLVGDITIHDLPYIPFFGNILELHRDEVLDGGVGVDVTPAGVLIRTLLVTAPTDKEMALRQEAGEKDEYDNPPLIATGLLLYVHMDRAHANLELSAVVLQAVIGHEIGDWADTKQLVEVWPSVDDTWEQVHAQYGVSRLCLATSNLTRAAMTKAGRGSSPPDTVRRVMEDAGFTFDAAADSSGWPVWEVIRHRVGANGTKADWTALFVGVLLEGTPNPTRRWSFPYFSRTLAFAMTGGRHRFGSYTWRLDTMPPSRWVVMDWVVSEETGSGWAALRLGSDTHARHEINESNGQSVAAVLNEILLAAIEGDPRCSSDPNGKGNGNGNGNGSTPSR